LINHLIAGRRYRDHAGNILGLAFLTQNLIDLGFALHGSPPAEFFMEWRDLPPGDASPQAAADGGGRYRALVMGKARGQQAARSGRHKTATPRHNPRWTNCNGGDRVNHPRYRDFATIPVADFLQ
jgi:hypothetical protein